MRRSGFPRRNKMNARGEHTEYGYFHSQLEKEHHQNLLLRKAAGEIESEIERQVFFKLYVNGEFICQIKPDFRYTKKGAHRPTIDEVKGYPDKAWPIRWALLKALHKDEYEFIVTGTADVRRKRKGRR